MFLILIYQKSKKNINLKLKYKKKLKFFKNIFETQK
jgi:hypothetical protein